MKQTMDTAKPYLSILSLLLFFSFSIYSSSSLPHQVSLAVGEDSRTTKVQISPSLKVVNSPGTNPGARLLFERVSIHGFPRLKLNKFSHSWMLKISPSNSSLRRPNVEVCFHRNASRAIGMCPQGEWEKVDKGGSWVRAMSPYAHKLLDIRMAGSSPETLEVSIEEGNEASADRSKELACNFYLLITCVCFNFLISLSYFYSPLKEGSYLFYHHFCSGWLGNISTSLPARVVAFNTHGDGARRRHVLSCSSSLDLAIFLLAFIALTGAWMGFWAVRSFVLKEDGSIDISTSHFVAWSIRVLAVVLILQSSLDPLMAAEALISGIIVSSILRKIFRWRFLRQMYKKLFKLARNINTESLVPDLSPFGGSHDNYTVERPEGSKFLSPRPKQFNLAPCNSKKGSSRTSCHQLSDSDVYLSTFHTTPERRKFSKDSWEKFTRESTRKAVKELVSSPDFSKWAAANAERITVTPNSTTSISRQHRRKWFLWS
ncbi:hypothetical protein SADUNF_Sadunf07G0004300 [Salix dunnii]|uniref:Uncharacterized protein n=1 Tax=Salix dunnii TaxID=1413687 RepID=A0A835N204_9ROSI|nr:hypothetical protein SADUNF_Sadunf07G0004300 [Salix dunnii]